MIRALAIAGISALLAGCATMMDAQDGEMDVVDRSEGECPAQHFQLLIGQLRDEVDTSTLPVPFRMYGRGDAVTMDYRPNRMNIVVGDNGRVEQVMCG